MFLKIRLRDNKAVALIIVIFAMMIFAVLGWTLTVMQSTDFEANLRNYDSERALSLAEAGAQWALNKLSIDTCGRTRLGVWNPTACSTVNTDCNDSGDWLTTPHTLSSGQYNICCRNPLASESGNAVIESRGYIPSQGLYRSRREVKVEVSLGTFDKVLLAKNLFDWSLARSGTRVIGIAQAANYERDGDGTYNEPGIDWAEGVSPLPPDGSGDSRLGHNGIVPTTPFPTITMSNYETWAGANTWAPPRTAVITSISEVDAGESRIVVSSNIFSNPRIQWEGQALRNLTKGSWAAGNWGEIKDCLTPGNDTVDLTSVVSWSVGDRVCVVPKISAVLWVGDTATVTFACNYFEAPLGQWVTANNVCALRNFRGSATWGYSEWGVIRSVPSANQTTVTIDASALPGTWAIGDWMGVVRRYRQNVTGPPAGSVWYIRGDVIFDVRNNQSWESGGINGNIRFRRTGVVLEGDAIIRGTNRLQFSERPVAYPNLATKNGNVTSPDTPAGATEDQRRLRRNFGDIIYSENGTVNFNYLDAVAVYGNNVTFDGQVILTYDSDLTQLTGFTWGLSNIKWREQ